MFEPKNGFEFLEELQNKTGKKVQSYSTFSKYLDTKAREKGIPIFGQFELTPLCNFDCKMCYVHLNADQLTDHKVLSVETWKNLISQAFEAGMISATLSGGECLTYPGFEELYLFLRNLGCELSVMTNGFLLNDQRIDFFKKHMPAEIKITLYGCNDDVYERVTGCRALSVVKNNICKAIEAGLPISLSITPSIYLGEDVFETIRIARDITKQISVNPSLFVPREETGRSEQKDDLDADFYISIYKYLNELNGIETKKIDIDKLPPIGGTLRECDKCGLKCGGGRSGFTINWKGVLMPCNRLEMISAYPLKIGFKNAWDKINQEANRWPRVPECEGCAYQEVCLNCAANMLQYAKPGKQPVGLCERTKYFVHQGVKLLKECDPPMLRNT